MESNRSIEPFCELSGGTNLREFVNPFDLRQLVSLWEQRVVCGKVAVVDLSAEEQLAGSLNLSELPTGQREGLSSDGCLMHQGQLYIERELTVGGTLLALVLTGPYSVEFELEEESVGVDELMKVLTTLAEQGYRVSVVNRLHLASLEDSHRELMHRTEHLELANAKLKELDSLKSNLLSTVSHELRTPLMGILGFAELLQNEIEAIEPNVCDQQQYVATILERGGHLLRLINRLLHLTSLERDNSSLSKEAFPVSDLSVTISDAVRKQACRRNLRIEEELSSAPFQLLADANLVREALSALIDNAIKFTRDGGKVQIGVELLTAPLSEAEVPCLVPRLRMVRIYVEDEGQGVEGCNRDRIFDPLYQVNANENRSHEGVGIGLTLARRIATAHGGEVTLDESDRNGSVFSLRIPEAGNA